VKYNGANSLAWKRKAEFQEAQEVDLVALKCNIDERGARARRVWGVMNLLVAALLGLLALWSGTWWLWIIVAACAAAGLFAMYEAQKKWCVMRAMGVKTRI
jgi:predicted lysophospholipase L1 biosynthesis ABC-type transport system permease subunit